MKTLNDILTEGDRMLLQDILRSHVYDVDYSEELYLRILDMPADRFRTLDAGLTSEIAEAISDKKIKHGMYSVIASFIMNKKWERSTEPEGILSSTGNAIPTVTIDSRMDYVSDGARSLMLAMLLDQPRTLKELYAYWDEEEVDRSWKFFKKDRFKEKGFAVLLGERDGEETMKIELCVENTITNA